MIFVRGGVAVGSVRWVGFSLDHTVKHLDNLSFARFYGTAVNQAVEMEKSSGPGILAFASDKAAEDLATAESDAVLAGPDNVLRTFPWGALESQIQSLRIQLKAVSNSSEIRHINATLRTLERFSKERATSVTSQPFFNPNEQRNK